MENTETKDLKSGEWVIVQWKKNQELAVIATVYTETNTVSVSVNPYKFDDTNTVINFKDVTKLSESQAKVLKQLVEEIEATEKILKKLKENIDLIYKFNTNH